MKRVESNIKSHIQLVVIARMNAKTVGIDNLKKTDLRDLTFAGNPNKFWREISHVSS